MNYENSIDKDMNYITNKKFKNIFELRKLKNDYMQNIMPKNVKNYILINYDNFILDPMKNINLIKEYYQLNLKNNELQNINNHIKKTIQLDPKYIKIIKENLDLEQELSLGFDVNDI